MDTPERVKRIMDSVKQKLEYPNKLTQGRILTFSVRGLEG